MYSSVRASKIEKKDVAFLPAGIHDNVKLVSARFDVSQNGSKFIEIKFEKEENGIVKGFSHTEWEPRRTQIDTDETFQEKCDKQFARIDQILQCFYPNPESRAFSGENFEEFAKWVVSLLNTIDKSILVRIKIIYNDKNYTTLPRYSKYTFIEPMSVVDAGKSVIVELGIDKFTKSVVADTEYNNPNPNEAKLLQTVEPTEDAVSDLPF